MSKFGDVVKKLLYPDGFKNLPLAVLIVISINIVFLAMAGSVIYSFLPHLVKYFGITEVDVGYYAGIIASSLNVGCFLSGFVWGYLADTMAKKNAAILAAILHALTTISLGFSRTIYLTAISRFLQGCSMGYLIVAKAILADVCDDTNMSFGMSMVMTAYSVGQLIGPSIGGFLVFPGQQYPRTFNEDNIFSKYIMLLPNLIIASGLGAGAILSRIFLSNIREYEEREGEEAILLLDSESVSFGGSKKKVYGTSEITVNKLSTHSARKETITGFTLVQKFKHSRFVAVLKIKDCLCTSLLYGLFCVIDIGLNEMTSLFAATDPKYKGMGFSTSKLATVLMIVSALSIPPQIIVFPKLIGRFGAKSIMVANNIILALMLPLLPLVAYIHKPRVLWCCLILLLFSLRWCIFTGLISINIFVNNSVHSELLGSANGVASSFASIGRLIAPLIFGSLYSWSLRNIKGVDGNENAMGFPFNQYFVFFVLSLWAILIALLTSRLPATINLKKVNTEI